MDSRRTPGNLWSGPVYPRTDNWHQELQFPLLVPYENTAGRSSAFLGHPSIGYGNINSAQLDLGDPFTDEACRSRSRDRIDEEEMPQGILSAKDGPYPERPRQVRDRSISRTPILKKTTLSASIPEPVDYELWRVEKDGDDWTHAIQTQLPASQKDLAKMARSKSKTGTALGQIPKMGQNRLGQVDELVDVSSKRTGLRWEVVWMEDVKAGITRRNKKDVRIFDVIIRCDKTGRTRPTIRRRSRTSPVPFQKGEEITRTRHRSRDSSVMAPVIRSRLSPLGKRFAQISPGHYDECRHFLLQNPGAVDEDHLQYLTEARSALDCEDEPWAKSCMEKLMYVRDCKDGRLKDYFDELFGNQERRNVFSNDLENALSNLKQSSQQVQDAKAQSEDFFAFDDPYEELLSQTEDSLRRLTHDLDEAKAEVRQKQKELDSVVAERRHQDKKLREEISRTKELREERNRQEALVERQERKRDEAKGRLRRLENEARSIWAASDKLVSALGQDTRAQGIPTDRIAPEYEHTQNIRYGSGQEDGRLPQYTELPSVQVLEEAPHPHQLLFLNDLLRQQGASECADVAHLAETASHTASRHDGNRLTAKECLVTPTAGHIDLPEGVHEAANRKNSNEEPDLNRRINFREPPIAVTEADSSTEGANSCYLAEPRCVAADPLSSEEQIPDTEDEEIPLLPCAIKAASHISPESILSGFKAPRLRARACSWPQSQRECFAKNHAAGDFKTDTECPEAGLEEENDLSALDSVIASTELDDLTIDEIEGYEIRQRELETAEQYVRAREDEVAIEKAKIDERQEQQRQAVMQLRKDRAAFVKTQQLQCQIAEEQQRNADELAKRLEKL